MRHNLIIFLLMIGLLPINLVYAKDNNTNLDEIVAIVNNQVITKKELQNKINYIKMEQQSSGQAPAEQKDKTLVITELNKIINIKLQLQLAHQNSIDVSKEEINRALMDIATRNNINLEQLKEYVTTHGQNFYDYLNQIKTEMILSKLHERILSAPKITDQEVHAYIKKHSPKTNKQEYNIIDLKITVPENDINHNELNQLITKIEANTKSVTSLDKIERTFQSKKYPLSVSDLGFLQEHEIPEIFLSPVKRLKMKEISNAIKAPNGIHFIQIDGIRDAAPLENINQYKIGLILIKSSMDLTPKEALAKITEIRNIINKGESFAKTAKLYSHDTKTASAGGELNWLILEELPKPLADAARSLSKGQLSQPITTDGGWYLIKVINIKSSDKAKYFEERKAFQMLFQQKMHKQLENFLKTHRKNAYIVIHKNKL